MLSDLESQMLTKYDISKHDFNILEEVVQLQQPYKAGKPWKFAGSFYYATTVLTTIGTYATVVENHIKKSPFSTLRVKRATFT